MYLVLPVFYLLARKSQGIDSIVAAWVLAALATLASFHIGYSLPDLLNYVPCFLSGVMAYKLAKLRRASLPFAGWPILIAIVTFSFLRAPRTERGWVCCLIVGLAVPQFREMSQGLFRKGCSIVARYSYGIYLTHFICIWAAFVALHSLPLSLRWTAFIAMLASLFPVALYHGLEGAIHFSWPPSDRSASGQ